MSVRGAIVGAVALWWCVVGTGPAAAHTYSSELWVATQKPTASQPAGAAALARIESAGVVNDSTYGPSEKVLVSVKNTGTVETRFLTVTLPNGHVFVDAEGQQTFIGNCNPTAFPLAPGASTTCDMYRLLTATELKSGRTLPFSLVVEVFGKTGPKALCVNKAPVEFDPSLFS